MADREYMDNLYREAVAHVLETQTASTGRLQRKLMVGYETAANLMRRMERERVVSEPDFRGRREILRKAS